MKLILAIIQTADETDTVQELNRSGFFVTKLSTTGGFLKAKNTTLLIGTDDEKVEAVFDVLKKHAGHRMQLSPVSGADMRTAHPYGSLAWRDLAIGENLVSDLILPPSSAMATSVLPIFILPWRFELDVTSAPTSNTSIPAASATSSRV